MPLVPVPDPYDFRLSTERFRAFGADVANVWHQEGLHRFVGGREVRIEAAPGGVLVEPLDGAVAADLPHLLGLSFDLAGFAAFAAADPVLAPLLERLRGFRPLLLPDPFEALVTAVSAQQISLLAATAIRNRLVARFGRRGRVAFAFPAADRVARASEDELVALGFSRRKAGYVLGVARSLPALRELAAAPDGEVKVRLVSIPGLGEWTADWFLARHLGRPRAWPAGDLGLRKAASLFCAAGTPLSVAEVRRLGARFAPFENLAAHYLLLALRLAPPGRIQPR